MLIGIMPINMFGCGYYRMLIPMHKLETKNNNFKVHAIFTKRYNDICEDEYNLLQEFVANKDVLVLQRRYGEAWESFAKWLHSCGKKIVYEMDDVFEGIPQENLKLNAKEMMHPATRTSVVNMLRMADAITVSTPELADWVCRYTEHNKVNVLKNTLDFTMWPEPHYGNKPEGEPIIVGYAGAEVHKTDLRELGSSLEMLSTQYNTTEKTNVLFGFMGYMLQEFWKIEPHIAYKQGVPFLEYPHHLASLKYDIALAPLKQCYFNECKSELRFLEHAMCGVPVIATNIAPYKRVVDASRGVLVENHTRKWKAAIKVLIEDAEMRFTLGENAYLYVSNHYNIDTYYTAWEQVYKQFL